MSTSFSLVKAATSSAMVAALFSLPACRKTAAPAASGEAGLAGMNGNGDWGGLKVRTTGERRNPKQVVILLHGWGAPGDDLVPLGQMLQTPGRLFVFPEAALVSPGGGRAWWHLDMDRLLNMRERGEDRDLRTEIPVGLADARAKLLAVVAEVKRRTGLPASSIVLGGFSQGAMLATDVALSLDEAPAGLVALSGTLLAEKLWQERLDKLPATFPAFVSHGQYDPVLPFHLAEALRDRLQAAKLAVTWVPFPGGHEIPRDVLTRLALFLDHLAVPA